MNKDIFKLTPEQAKAFKALEKAYSKCVKSGIFFANNYGSLMAFDKSIVCGYGDSVKYAKGVSEVSEHEAGGTVYQFKIANEWADDEHYYGLTRKGHMIYFGD